MTTTASAPSLADAGHRRPLTRNDLRTLGLSALGGTLEFYDFVVFVFFANVLGALFFPADMPDWLRQLQTLGIFEGGYLARPLGGDYRFEVERGYPAGRNDPTVTGWVEQVVTDMVGADQIERNRTGMGAEDFAYMTQRAPGMMFGLGAALGDGVKRAHHTPIFDVDEGVLPLGAAVLAETARRYLAERHPLSTARAACEQPAGTRLEQWRGIAEQGWPALLAPAAHEGLGLGIVREVAARHHARMVVTPRTGGGTSVQVVFPLPAVARRA